MIHYIHVEEVHGTNRSVIKIEAPTMREALHKAADRIIEVYADGGPILHYSKREENWTGYPHPSLVISVNNFADGGDIETLTACTLWDKLCD